MQYSDSDFERLYLRYMAEAMPRGESIQAFCSRNKVPYNLYDKWYTDTLHKVVPVNVNGKPREEKAAEPLAQPLDPNAEVRIMVSLNSSTG